MKQQSNIFLSLIKELDVPHTKDFTVKAYEEHPYKYTFYGLKSLCETYKIRTEGLCLEDKDEILNLSTPFVADFANDYVLVKSLSTESAHLRMYGIDFNLPFEQFKEGWKRNLLLFYPDENSSEPDLKSHQRISGINRLEWAFLIIAITLLLGYRLALNLPSLCSAGIMTTSLVGIILCIMLLGQQLKVQNPIAEKICHAFKSSSCNNVLETKAAKFLGRYAWAEIGFSYFIVNFLFVLFSNQYNSLLAWIGTLALPYSIWSICYQKHISQWCPLCIAVQMIIVIQFIIYFLGGLLVFPCYLSISHVIVLLCAYGITGILIFKFSSILSNKEEMVELKWQYNHLKMNIKVFNTLLMAEKEFPTSGSSIVFGKKDATFHITVFSNPYCNPCGEMHKRLQNILEKGNCQIQYVFTSFKPEWNVINKYLIATYQQLGTEEAWNIFSLWYDKGKYDEEHFFKPYNVDINTKDVEKEFNLHENWREQSKLNATPTILINGHKMPYGYIMEDLENLE